MKNKKELRRRENIIISVCLTIVGVVIILGLVTR